MRDFFILSTFHHFLQFSMTAGGMGDGLCFKNSNSLSSFSFFKERDLEKDIMYVGAWGKEF